MLSTFCYLRLIMAFSLYNKLWIDNNITSEFASITEIFYKNKLYPSELIKKEPLVFIDVMDYFLDFRVRDIMGFIAITKGFSLSEFDIFAEIVLENHSPSPYKKRKIIMEPITPLLNDNERECLELASKIHKENNAPKFCKYSLINISPYGFIGKCTRGKQCSFLHMPDIVLSKLAAITMSHILCVNHVSKGICRHIHAKDIIRIFLNNYAIMGTEKFTKSLLDMYELNNR
jgi:hypothetical protein